MVSLWLPALAIQVMLMMIASALTGKSWPGRLAGAVLLFVQPVSLLGRTTLTRVSICIAVLIAAIWTTCFRISSSRVNRVYFGGTVHI